MTKGLLFTASSEEKNQTMGGNKLNSTEKKEKQTYVDIKKNISHATSSQMNKRCVYLKMKSPYCCLKRGVAHFTPLLQ